MDSGQLKAPVHIRVQGDSMWPTIHNGDILLIEDELPVAGEIVLAKHPLTQEYIVKRVRSILNNRAFLESDNPDPTAGQDSHSFGTVPLASICGVMKNPI